MTACVCCHQTCSMRLRNSLQSLGHRPTKHVSRRRPNQRLERTIPCRHGPCTGPASMAPVVRRSGLAGPAGTAPPGKAPSGPCPPGSAAQLQSRSTGRAANSSQFRFSGVKTQTLHEFSLQHPFAVAPPISVDGVEFSHWPAGTSIDPRTAPHHRRLGICLRSVYPDCRHGAHPAPEPGSEAARQFNRCGTLPCGSGAARSWRASRGLAKTGRPATSLCPRARWSAPGRCTPRVRSRQGEDLVVQSNNRLHSRTDCLPCQRPRARTRYRCLSDLSETRPMRSP